MTPELRELLQRGASKGKAWEQELRDFSSRTEWPNQRIKFLIHWFESRYELMLSEGVGHGTLTGDAFWLHQGVLVSDPQAFYHSLKAKIGAGPSCVIHNFHGQLEDELGAVRDVCLQRERNPDYEVPEPRIRVVSEPIDMTDFYSSRKKKRKKSTSDVGEMAALGADEVKRLGPRQRKDYELKRKYAEAMASKREKTNE